MEEEGEYTYIIHNVGELDVLKLSPRSILPTKRGTPTASYILHSPFDFVVKSGSTKSVTMDLCVSYKK